MTARPLVLVVPLLAILAVVVLALDVFGVRTWFAEWAAYTLLEEVGLT